MNTRASPTKVDADKKSYIKRELKKIIDKRPEFKKELISRKIYGIFVSTTTEYIQRHVWPSEIEHKLNRIARHSSPIDSAMSWSHTKQGHRYWCSINCDMPYLRDGFDRK